MIDLLTQDEHIKDLEEFDDHRCVYRFSDRAIGLKGYIAVHRKNGGMPSFGASRLWNYASEGEALRDALGLSRTMSYKSALAGLPYGGAKAVIMETPQWKSNRAELLHAYAEKVNELGGAFVTGTDVGLSQDDLRIMGEKCKFFVGFNNNATESTGLGIYYAMQVCLSKVFGSDDMSGRTFAIQGIGKVGTELVELIYKAAKKIYVADINPSRIRDFERQFPNCAALNPQEIHKQAVDVYSPCALSHALNKESVNELKCRIVCGGANNQLQNQQIGNILSIRGIVYAPDYVANAGGLISVADEHENKKFNKSRVAAKVFKIKNTMKEILEKSEKINEGTNFVANMMAEKIFNNYK